MNSCEKWFVYMLRCSDGSLYTGITVDLRRRVEQHNSGHGAKCLRGRLPVEPVWSLECPDRGSALQEEARIKKMSRSKKNALLISSAGQSLLLSLRRNGVNGVPLPE